MMKVLVKLITLGRIGMLPLSFSIPIMGALSLQHPLTILQFVVLGIIGISAHFFGFIINDLIDYRLDKHSPYRQQSPLVNGDIQHWQAWIFALTQIPIAFGLYLWLNSYVLGLIWIILSIFFSLIYNLFSKWRWLPRIIAEIALALSITFLAIGGASIFDSNLPSQVWLYCGSLGLVLLLVNSVPSGLKDVQADTQHGARSFVITMGVTVTADGQLTIPPNLKRYVLIVQSMITVLSIGLGIIYQIGVMAWLLIIMLQFFAWLHSLRLIQIQHVEELPEVFLFLGGYYNYLNLVIYVWVLLPLLFKIVLAILMLYLLLIPFRRAWAVYRQRHKFISNLR